MKLVVEITDGRTKGGHLIPYIDAKFATDRDDDAQESFSQAERVARLTEVCTEVRKVVNAYYSKGIGLMPRVVKHNTNSGWRIDNDDLFQQDPFTEK